MEAVNKIESVKIDTGIDLAGFADAPRAWLEKQPSVGDETWLLAYADDGVIWGRLKNGSLLLAGDKDIFAGQFPPLEYGTLQRLYLFGEDAEIHVWKDGGGLKAARTEGGPDAEGHSLEEALVLWGSSIAQAYKNGFTLMEDGAQGLRHAVPLEVQQAHVARQAGDPLKRPLRLVVRRYLDYNPDTGEAYVRAARMVCLFVEQA